MINVEHAVAALRRAAEIAAEQRPPAPQDPWQHLEPELVPLARIVFPCHDLDPAHVHGPVQNDRLDRPVLLEQLLDGDLFVHDGRHRVLRARAAGQTEIAARVHRHP
jgi:hypothetical protein